MLASWLRSESRVYCAPKVYYRPTLVQLGFELVEIEEADEVVARAGLGASVARVLRRRQAAVLCDGLRGEAQRDGEEEQFDLCSLL